tara:strand:- start:245 stop:1183 length:939 start_codon:yes stop_codon:yes gene_type:complete
MYNDFHKKIGVIGKGSQFKRISKILRKKRNSYFLYKPNNSKYYDKKEFDKLSKCQIIFILSPNHTHFKYIKKFYKNKYIFCEKPPVNSRNDLIKLKKINHKKIYFNYNFRYSLIGQILSDRKKYKLGDLLYGNIITGHGLGFKKEYLTSWRSNLKLCKKGVFEIVSIHWIDLINYFFNINKIQKPKLINFLKKGTSFDNSYCKINLKKSFEVDLFSSYSSPLINKILFVFKNGTIEKNENFIEIRGPAINLNKKNFFIKPKLIKKIKINEFKDYNDSLKKSVDYFLKISLGKKYFNKKNFDRSIKSNEILLS